MQILLTIVAGVVVFLLGQMLQQFILEPMKEFRTQRADAIYFVARFLTSSDFSKLDWDRDEKSDIKQMSAALIFTIELIPCYDLLSAAKIFGLSSRSNVRDAAAKISMLADIVNAKSEVVISRDVDLAQEIAKLLGAKISLMSLFH